MKKVFHLLLIIILISQLSILNSSCTQDAYEKGEGELSAMVAEMGDGFTASDKKVTRFVTDDDEQFAVSNPFSSNLMPKADTVYRAIFYYVKNGGEAEVKGLNRVLVVSPRKIEEMKTDPVRVESVWMGKSKRYLNLSLYLMGGQTDSKDDMHHLSCQQNISPINTDGTKTLHLTLYHDQGGVPEYYSQRVYLSIPVHSAGADSVCIHINTYQGIVKRTLKL